MAPLPVTFSDLEGHHCAVWNVSVSNTSRHSGYNIYDVYRCESESAHGL